MGVVEPNNGAARLPVVKSNAMGAFLGLEGFSASLGVVVPKLGGAGLPKSMFIFPASFACTGAGVFGASFGACGFVAVFGERCAGEKGNGSWNFCWVGEAG